LSLALYGILDKDPALFNEGLALQLQYYQVNAQGESKDTSEEFVCDHAVALANLAIGYKMDVTVEHDTLPKGLLLEVERQS
ncbi:MAG: hypothetical protein ACKE51_03795, partial [Methylococcaceae bacterium]